MHNIHKILAIALLWAGLLGSGLQVHAADGVAFNPVPVPITAKGAGGVPVGTVIVWPVSTPPDEAEKWLECDGRSTAGYPELAAKIGGAVPDYRGYFLRGNGGDSAALGQAQGDAIRNITGTFGGAGLVNSAHYSDGVMQSIGGWFPWSDHSGSWNAPMFRLDASRQVPTALENRPVNKSVRYLIKAISFNFNFRQLPWEEIQKNVNIALLPFRPCLTS